MTPTVLTDGHSRPPPPGSPVPGCTRYSADPLPAARPNPIFANWPSGQTTLLPIPIALIPVVAPRAPAATPDPLQAYRYPPAIGLSLRESRCPGTTSASSHWCAQRSETRCTPAPSQEGSTPPKRSRPSPAPPSP